MTTNEKNTCALCGKEDIITTCEHCGKPLCRTCRQLEIWGTGAEDLSVKYFCQKCKDDPDVNPWGAREKEFGLGEVMDLVNTKSSVRAA